ncbi:tRNA-dihydrouridine(16/17) synthase [Penicillium chermesinum]|uniref:tRNA-dihydrouridine(16/17) synthase n=1 Tax=Penicillium chermesinum TaxID=63820 RepID=A0A9W9NUV4_9EURO|nr:tRNA-dihydrouridine(16/17) synthase [Penicillium chermesinum]KAJ5226438.1 tRNA-dihydrouridine(16/17) synthase [Penicillium chermesinum]
MSTTASPQNGASNGPEHTPVPTPKKKLQGRQFYESIGSPKYVVAPMVDRSEFAWRMLTRSFMSPDEKKQILAYSPMYHARLFGEQAKMRSQFFQPTRGSAAGEGNRDEKRKDELYLDGNPLFDRPLFVQFCANDPNEFLEAARHVAPYCDAEDWDLIYRLINKLHTELSVPVTAKFRIQETKEKTLEYAKMILSAGANIITVHGRRREQKGHETGLADWSYIRYLRDNLPPDTVIFANGNILNYDDLERCLKETGADAVMSAEGNLSDPTIFSKPPAVGSGGREYWWGRDGKGGYRIDAVLRRYYDIIYRHVLEQPIPERKPLFIPSDPVDEATEAHESEEEEGPPQKKQKKDKHRRSNSPSLRYALARSKGGDMPAFEHVLTLVERAIKSGLLEYEANPEKFERSPDVTLTGSKATIAEYGRPWWVCQPHIRPLPEEALVNGALTAKGSVTTAKGRKDDEPPAGSKSAASEKPSTPANGGSETSATLTPDNLVSG